MTDIKQVVMEFAGKIGLGSLAFDEHDIAGIQFDDMALNFHADGETGDLTLFLRLVNVPADPAERLAAYAFLLKTNNFARQTGGCVLGVDDQEEWAYLCHRIPAGALDVPRLERVVEAFLNLAESLKAEFMTIGRTEMPEAGHIPAGSLRA